MAKSPMVLSISWGRMEVAGLGTGKDFKLYPGGGVEWDWNQTGTRHSPGIQPADVEDLLAHGATTVVLSRGGAASPGLRSAATREGDAGKAPPPRERSERQWQSLFHSTC